MGLGLVTGRGQTSHWNHRQSQHDMDWNWTIQENIGSNSFRNEQAETMKSLFNEDQFHFLFFQGLKTVCEALGQHNTTQLTRSFVKV